MVPEFPIDTALFGVVGAVIAVAVKILLGKKKSSKSSPTPKPPPTDTKVHDAAVAIAQEDFEEGVSEISDANSEKPEEERLKRLAELTNQAKRR